jgi:hypothetical protein
MILFTTRLLVGSPVNETIHLTAGSLKHQAFVHPAANITQLTLTGTIDARDMQYIRDSMTLLTTLDISDVSLVAYTGTEGTYYGAKTVYPANEMPAKSFSNAMQTSSPLTSISLPPNLTSIGEGAFFLANQLASIVFPASLVSIGDWAFYACSALTTITLPANLTSIGEGAFYDCSTLDFVSLPADLIIINDKAFNWCSALTVIRNQNPIPILFSNMDIFWGVNKERCILKVPAESIRAYEAAPIWKDFLIEEDTAAAIVETNKAITSLTIYPNPVKDLLFIQSSLSFQEIVIYDINGKIVQRAHDMHPIPVHDWANGIYIVNGKTSEGEIMRTILKQ